MKAIDILNITTEMDVPRYKHLSACGDLAKEILEEVKIPSELKEKIIGTVLLHDIGYSNELKNTGQHSFDGYFYLSENFPGLVFEKSILFHGDFINVMSNSLYKEVEGIYDTLTDLEMIVLHIIDYCDTHIDGKGNEVTINGRWSDLEKRHKGINPEKWEVALKTKEYAYFVENTINYVLDRLEKIFNK